MEMFGRCQGGNDESLGEQEELSGVSREGIGRLLAALALNKLMYKGNRSVSASSLRRADPHCASALETTNMMARPDIIYACKRSSLAGQGRE